MDPQKRPTTWEGMGYWYQTHLLAVIAHDFICFQDRWDDFVIDPGALNQLYEWGFLAKFEPGGPDETPIYTASVSGFLMVPTDIIVTYSSNAGTQPKG